MNIDKNSKKEVGSVNSASTSFLFCIKRSRMLIIKNSVNIIIKNGRNISILLKKTKNDKFR